MDSDPKVLDVNRPGSLWDALDLVGERMPSPSQLQYSGGFPPTPPLFSFRLRRAGRCQEADKYDFETDTISEGTRFRV